MKNLLLTFGLLFMALTLCAEVTLHGLITYQNTGAKMSAIQITARGATPTITRATSTKEGVFVLTFPNAKVGEVVTLEIGTPIYDLVNDPRELQVVLTEQSDFRVRLVVCKKGERDANAVAYYNISTKYLETNFNKEIKKRDTEITKIKRQLAQNRTNADALNQKIYALELEKANLDNQLQAQMKNAWQLAEDFSRVDLAQADNIYRQAFEAFQQGDVDGARQILNSQEARQQEEDLRLLNTSIEKSERQVEQVKDSIQAAERRINLAKYQRDSLRQMIIKKKGLNAHLATLQYKFDDAEQLYLERVNLDSMNAYILWDFACFLTVQNKMNRAALYYEKCLRLVITERLEASVRNNLGMIYSARQKPEEAKKMLLRALEIYERLAKSDTGQYESDIALTTRNFGNLYRIIHKNKEAEEMYLRSLKIYKGLGNSNPAKFRPQEAQTAINLGNLYRNIQKIPKADSMYQHALSIYIQEMKNGHTQVEPDLAKAALNVGNFYSDIKKIREAEMMYLYSLKIRTKLAEKNPAQFEPDLARTELNLANFYANIEMPDKAKKMYLSSLKTYEKLAKSDSVKFDPYVALVAMNFGTFNEKNQNLVEAEKMHRYALDIYTRLAKSDFVQFGQGVARVANNLGICYQILQKMTEAEEMHMLSLRTYKQLMQIDSAEFEPELAYTLMSLGVFYLKVQRIAEAENMHINALAIYERLAKYAPSVYEYYLATALHKFAFFRMACGQLKDARLLYSRSLVLRKKAVLSGLNHQRKELEQVYKDMVKLRDSFEVRRDYAVVMAIQRERAACMDSLLHIEAKWAKQVAQDYDTLAYYALFARDFPASEFAARRGLLLNPKQEGINRNLALALLYQNEWPQAQALYIRFIDQKYDKEIPWKQVFREDLKALEAVSIKCADAEKIWKMLRE